MQATQSHLPKLQLQIFSTKQIASCQYQNTPAMGFPTVTLFLILTLTDMVKIANTHLHVMKSIKHNVNKTTILQRDVMKFTHAFDSQLVTQSSRHTVMLSLGQLVTGAFFSQSHVITQSSRHKVISLQASTLQSYGWAMLNYAGEAGEAGNDYTSSFAAVAIFQDTPWSDPQNWG